MAYMRTVRDRSGATAVQIVRALGAGRAISIIWGRRMTSKRWRRSRLSRVGYWPVGGANSRKGTSRVIGIDPHKSSHTTSALDTQSYHLADLLWIEADLAYRRLLS